MTIEAQPAIKGTTTSENGITQSVNYPLLVDVPIVYPGSSAFTITFPLVQGDEVLVIISSRCIDSWFQSGGVQPPPETRMHDLSDGFAIPGPRSQPRVVPGISSTNFQIKKADGTTLFDIAPNGDVTLMGDLIFTGDLHIDGDITSTGKVTADGEVQGAGIKLSTHTHSGVQPGGGTSGPPTP